MQFCVRHHSFRLLAEKAIYWENKNALLIADLHLSKETHYRKNGIAVPDGITNDNLHRLGILLRKFNPEKIIVLGDLFHSDINLGIQLFAGWKQLFNGIPFLLISGNHDIMPAEEYKKLQIELSGETLVDDEILLAHQPIEHAGNNYLLCGHIHPAVRLKGKAKQSVRIPCFWFGKNTGVLPAFGGFTGMHNIVARKEDAVFGIADNTVMRIQ